MKQLGWPTLLCHRLEVVNGKILDYKLPNYGTKKAAVAALKALSLQSHCRWRFLQRYRDARGAEVGILFRAPENIKREFSRFPAVETYRDLLERIRKEF